MEDVGRWREVRKGDWTLVSSFLNVRLVARHELLVLGVRGPVWLGKPFMQELLVYRAIPGRAR